MHALHICTQYVWREKYFRLWIGWDLKPRSLILSGDGATTELSISYRVFHIYSYEVITTEHNTEQNEFRGRGTIPSVYQITDADHE